MISEKCTKKGCFHPRSEKGFTVHWRKFSTELLPASDYGGYYRLAKTFFENPNVLAKEFGELRLGCPEI
jgi:hypothetical protein